jgi:hypothetical protein
VPGNFPPNSLRQQTSSFHPPIEDVKRSYKIMRPSVPFFHQEQANLNPSIPDSAITTALPRYMPAENRHCPQKMGHALKVFTVAFTAAFASPA